MKYTAINYFPNIGENQIEDLAEAILSSGLDLTYAGKSKHTRTWSGEKADLISLISEKNGFTSSTYFDDVHAYPTVSVELMEEPQSDFSYMQFSHSSKEELKLLANSFIIAVGSYACITCELQPGEKANWQLYSQSKDCPNSVKQVLQNA